MIEVMNDEPRGWTARELAERLDSKQTKLYHHLGLLEDQGIIRIAETRMVSGILEKRYQVTARSFRIDRSLLSGDSDSVIDEVLDVVFDRARDEIVEAIRAGLIDLDASDPKRRRMALSMTHARLSPKRVRRVMRFIEQLNAIDDPPDDEGEDYGLVIGFYPRATPRTER
jgi:DNA-binding transcriptional ArsR family regulator